MKHIVHGSFHYEFESEKRANQLKEWFKKSLNGVKDAKKKRVSVEMVSKPGGV